MRETKSNRTLCVDRCHWSVKLSILYWCNHMLSCWMLMTHVSIIGKFVTWHDVDTCTTTETCTTHISYTFVCVFVYETFQYMPIMCWCKISPDPHQTYFITKFKINTISWYFSWIRLKLYFTLGITALSCKCRAWAELSACLTTAPFRNTLLQFGVSTVEWMACSD